MGLLNKNGLQPEMFKRGTHFDNLQQLEELIRLELMAGYQAQQRDLLEQMDREQTSEAESTSTQAEAEQQNTSETVESEPETEDGIIPLPPMSVSEYDRCCKLLSDNGYNPDDYTPGIDYDDEHQLEDAIGDWKYMDRLREERIAEESNQRRTGRARLESTMNASDAFPNNQQAIFPRRDSTPDWRPAPVMNLNRRINSTATQSVRETTAPRFCDAAVQVPSKTEVHPRRRSSRSLTN